MLIAQLWRTTGCQRAVVVIVEHRRVVHHCLPVRRRCLDLVRKLATESAQQTVRVGGCAAHRNRVRAIGDVRGGQTTPSFFSRSHDAVIRVYDGAGSVVETHEHAGEWEEW